MKHKILNSSLTPLDLLLHQNDLLQIAKIDYSLWVDSRVKRADLVQTLRTANAMAFLISIALHRAWDRIIQITDDGRVFMRFRDGDLFAASALPVPEILKSLREFEPWRDAMLALNLRALSSSKTSAPSADLPSADDIEAAHSNLNELRNHQAGVSESSLHEVFTQWAKKYARTSEITLMAGSVQGDSVSIKMPQKARIVEPTKEDLATNLTENDSDLWEIVDSREMLLIRGLTGNHFLVPRDSQSPMPSPGETISYSKQDRRLVSCWKILD
jgi:hypothetical protein